MYVVYHRFNRFEPWQYAGQQRFVVDMGALQRAWESSQRSTKDDWDEWMRHFAVVLLKESPSPALRSTCDLAMVCALAGAHQTFRAVTSKK